MKLSASVHLFEKEFRETSQNFNSFAVPIFQEGFDIHMDNMHLMDKQMTGGEDEGV